MSVAEVIDFSARRFGRRSEKSDVWAPPVVPIALDDLGLTPAAFRLFFALCRRARQMDGGWWVVEGLGEIGRICFSGALPTAQAPRLRIMASDAIKELELFGLLRVERAGRGKENRYELLPQDQWKQPKANWKQTKRRRAKSKIAAVPTSDPVAPIEPVAPVEDPVVAAVEPIVAIELADDEEITYEFTLADDEPEIELPAAPTAFDPKTYAWAEFTIGCPVLPPAFWIYTLNLMEGVKRQREQTGHANQIDDVELFAQGVVRRNGCERYEFWAKSTQSIPKRLLNAPLYWGKTVPTIDPETARSLIHGYWRDLGLGWTDDRLLAWMAQAAQIFPDFEYSPASNFYNLPEPLLAKLCGDLETTIQRLFPGAS